MSGREVRSREVMEKELEVSFWGGGCKVKETEVKWGWRVADVSVTP